MLANVVKYFSKIILMRAAAILKHLLDIHSHWWWSTWPAQTNWWYGKHLSFLRFCFWCKQTTL